MKSAIKLIIAFSVLSNLYGAGTWLYVFNRVDTHPQRVDQFLKFFPFGLSASLLMVGFFLLTLLSLVLLLKIKTQNLWMLMLPVQLTFVAFYLWQFM